MNIESRLLPQLNSGEIDALISCFNNNALLKEYPGRRFALDLDVAMDIVTPIIDSVLGKGIWICTGGNFFETTVPYRIHADTGKDGPSKIFQTFVFPLLYELSADANLENNRLFILDQVWKGDAAFFVKGTNGVIAEYNQVVTDYRDVIGLSVGLDNALVTSCPHLDASNFEGLTLDKSLIWTPGIPITFPRDRLHVTSAFTRFGVKKKLGLSIFTSYRDQ